MSIRLETERIKNAKENIIASVMAKGTDVPEDTKLDEMPQFIEQIETGSSSIVEQLPQPVTNVQAETVSDTSIKLTWTNPNDPIQNVDIAIGEGALPTFPLKENELYGTIGSSSTITIEGLTAGTQYGFLVMPKGTNGLRQTCVTTDNNILTLLSGGGVFMIVDRNGKVYHCTDGISWTYVTQIPDIVIDGNSLYYANKKFIVSGRDSAYKTVIYYSTDGVTWTPGTADVSRSVGLTDFTYGNGMILALSAGNNTMFFKSTDGINWTQQGSSMPTGYQYLRYGNGVFLILKDNKTICSSTDGATWTSVATPSGSNNLYGLNFCNDKFIVVGSGGRVYYSTDGATWTQGTGLNTNNLYYWVCYSNGIYIAIAEGKTEYGYSTDGINWTLQNTLPHSIGRSTLTGNNAFMGIGYMKSCISTDGINWTSLSGGSDTNVNASCFGNL